jgi:type I restriction enzyme S subunit
LIKLGCDDSLPPDWKWVKANDIMDVRDGTHDSPKSVEKGIPLVTSKNLVDGKIDFSTCNLISEVDHEAISRRSAVDTGDILYAMIGTIGNPVIVDKKNDFSIKNVALFKFTKSKEVCNKFIYHLLNSGIAVRQFQSNSRGGTQKFVSLGNIRELQIPLPPLPEQKRIAAILDKADAIRRKRQRAIRLADDFLRAVFLDMFGNPVTNPNKLPKRKFGSIAEFINGDRSGNYPSGDDVIDSGVLFLNTKNISGNKLSFKKTTFISQDKFDSLSRGKLQRKDLVITLRGTLGSCAIFDSNYETGFINAQIMIIRCNKDLLPEYLHALLTSKPFNMMLQSIGNGAAVQQLTATQLKSLEIPTPSMALQKKFVEILRQFGRIHGKLEVSGMQNLFDSVSNKAFSGQL